MHATRDTVPVKISASLGRARDARRSAAPVSKPMTEACGWQRRAASSRHDATILLAVAALTGYHRRGVAGGAGFEYRGGAAGAGCLRGAPEQANAPDRRHDGCYLPLTCGAAGDWRR
ncbi:MAG: hypothetical protein M3362_01590 [Acidobacteriota bacterium]|nr:hypothetical protein [Acidobacteriota bacterium]